MLLCSPTHQYRLFSSASDLCTTQFSSRAWGGLGQVDGQALSRAHKPHAAWPLCPPMTPQPSPGPVSQVCAPSPAGNRPHPPSWAASPGCSTGLSGTVSRPAAATATQPASGCSRHDRNRSVQVAADRPSRSQAPSHSGPGPRPGHSPAGLSTPAWAPAGPGTQGSLAASAQPENPAHGAAGDPGGGTPGPPGSAPTASG